MRLKTLGTSTRADNFLQPSASFLSSSILANSIDDKSQLLQESSLNSWIRQQGVSLPKKRELPKLIERKNDLSFITTSSKSSTKQEKKSKLLPKLRGKSSKLVKRKKILYELTHENLNIFRKWG